MKFLRNNRVGRVIIVLDEVYKNAKYLSPDCQKPSLPIVWNKSCVNGYRQSRISWLFIKVITQSNYRDKLGMSSIMCWHDFLIINNTKSLLKNCLPNEMNLLQEFLHWKYCPHAIYGGWSLKLEKKYNYWPCVVRLQHFWRPVRIILLGSLTINRSKNKGLSLYTSICSDIFLLRRTVLIRAMKLLIMPAKEDETNMHLRGLFSIHGSASCIKKFTGLCECWSYDDVTFSNRWNYEIIKDFRTRTKELLRKCHFDQQLSYSRVQNVFHQLSK